MNTVFAGILGKEMLCYLDDIIIMSSTIEEHFCSLRKVFERLFNAGLKIKLKKCFFLKKQLKFLGHTVNKDGIATQDNKIEAVTKFPVPNNADRVKSFLCT